MPQPRCTADSAALRCRDRMHAAEPRSVEARSEQTMTDPDHPEPNQEFERRFLVSDASVIRDAKGDRIDQGYLWVKDGNAIRVRLVSPEESGEAWAVFTLKGPREGNRRFEFEQPLPIEYARELYELSTYRISKVRYAAVSEGETWIVDVFEGANEGLVIAEFEASSAAVERIKKPWWCAEEVTSDARYANDNLARTPYSQW